MPDLLIMLSKFYRFYRFSTAIKYFLFRRILPAGWGVLIAITVSSTMLMGNPITPLYQIFAISVSLASLALMWAWARRAKLSGQRYAGPHASVGQAFRYQISLINHGRNLGDVFLSESPPDPRPSRALFESSREPGEIFRNGFDRFFAFNRWQWLLEKGKAFDGGQTTVASSLEAKKSKTFSLEIIPNRRGLIKLQDVRVLLPDPFRFFQRARKVPTPPTHIAVLPQRYQLPMINLPGTAQFQLGGDSASQQNGSTGEFTSLREYRHGDSPRQIHWKSWARTGRPIIKEVEDVYFPRYALVLDTFADPQEELAFEESVSVAASFVSAIDTNEALLDLMFLGDCDHVITAGKGVADSIKLLEVLAAVQISNKENFGSLLQLILRHRDDLTACICLFTGWSQSRTDFLQLLEKSGLQYLAITVVSHPEKHQIPSRVHVLQPATIKEDLLRLAIH
jgi:hypothetical protein